MTSGSASEKLFLALDVSGASEALDLVKRLKPMGLTQVKVGMSLFYEVGPRILDRLKEQDVSVFLDLKLHDIPSTVGRTVDVLVRAGASFLNVHALGGLAMMQAAVEAAQEAAEKSGQADPTIIAVTILTSHSESTLAQELNLANPIPEAAALHLAKQAQKAGMAGVVCSPHEAKAIRQACGEAFLKVTPGIRPAEQQGQDDQQRAATPRGAISNGATHLVIGRPIYQAADPERAFQTVLEQVGQALAKQGAVS